MEVDFLEKLKACDLDFGELKDFALYEVVECLKRGDLEGGKFYQEIYNICKRKNENQQIQK